jgi:Icc-related predicted phosphoesterase
MRLLCVSDVHYHRPPMEWILNRAADFDAVILAGDHLDSESPVPLESQIVDVSAYLSDLSQLTIVMVASGNHDLDGPGPEGEQRASWLSALRGPQLYGDGQSMDVDGVRFTVCPWWDGPRTKEIVESQLGTAAVNRPASWIWVYHAPPAGTRICKTTRSDYGDSNLTQWIDRWQPEMVICGHIHQAPWVEGGGWFDRRGQTWVFNAGHEIGHEPAHIVIDLASREATWVAVPDEVTIAL